MDFSFNISFGPTAAETRAEFDSKVEQVLIDFEDGNGGGSGWVVA